MKLPPIYPIVDDTLLATRGMSLIGAAEALLEEGARILQVRRKGHFGRTAFEECEQIAALCSAAGALLVINDRADIAKILGAGLHVGQEDLPAVSARTIMGGDAVIGLSTHNRTQFDAGEAEPVDYLALGPIFATSNKIDPDPVVGTAELGRLRSRTVKPIVAIGGVTRVNAHQAWRVGADSVAVIGDLYPEPCTRTSIMERFREWKRLAGE